ncbi:hypothetical protein JTB14_002928 [Gonioctena quinquepunctata]|nr:hypothetical protein JTB14_002928 [Gonioctena quinquepunctata]
MPSDYKPGVGGKRYKKTEPNIIEVAQQDIRNVYSIRQAAKKHNIAYNVLQRHLQHNDVEKQGGQTVLEKLLMCSEWGYPLDTFGLRRVIQQYLNRAVKVVSRFKNNIPHKEFAYRFLKRHLRILSGRMCQNI